MFTLKTDKIRFKVWDSVNRQMLSSSSYLVNCKGELYFKDKKQEKLLSKSDYKLLRWTGLFDTNNLPIYEGDILQTKQFLTPKGDPFSNSFEEHIKIFKISTTNFYKDCLYLESLLEDIDFAKGAEPGVYGVVIGNIYENLDLLEELSDIDDENEDISSTSLVIHVCILSFLILSLILSVLLLRVVNL